MKMVSEKQSVSSKNNVTPDFQTGSKGIFIHSPVETTIKICHPEFFSTSTLLKDCLDSLIILRGSIIGDSALLEAIEQFVAYVQLINNPTRPMYCNSTAELLKPLIDMPFWFPTRFICRLHFNPLIMLLMAHLHEVVLLANPVVEDGDHACIRRLNAAPIHSFHDEFTMKAEKEIQMGRYDGQYQRSLLLMNFPLDAVAAFENRLSTLRITGGIDGALVGECQSLTESTDWIDHDRNGMTLRIWKIFRSGFGTILPAEWVLQKFEPLAYIANESEPANLSLS